MLHIAIKKGIIKVGIFMKQSFLLILATIFIIICVVCIILINVQAEQKSIKQANSEFEKYLNKEVLGTEVATLISKVIDQNEKNSVLKNDKGYYIENDENSIKIDLKMTTINKTYPMEAIYNNGMISFVENFNLINFKCTSIEYHKKTGKISKLVFEEL